MDDVFKCAILSSARKRRELPDAKLQTDALLRRHALPRLAEAGKHRPNGAEQARVAALPRDAPCVFERKYVYAEPRPLELDAMRRAAAQLCGRHEFSAFSTGKKTGRAATRTIESIGIERCGEEVRLTYTGDGFLYNMVRILTGTLLEVGLGERCPDEMEAILASHSRASAGFTAPAQGLFLWDVTY